MNILRKYVANQAPLLNVVTKRFRKPAWVPPSPSKIFRIPKPRPVEPHMKQEMTERFAKYNSEMTVLCDAIKAKVKRQTATIQETDSKKEQFALDAETDRVKERQALNEKWNGETALSRKAWMSEVDSNEQQRRIKARVDKELLERVDQEIVDAFVLEMQADAENIIKREEVTAAIETALDNVVDYNFAIDSQGNVYKHGNMETNLLLGNINYKPPVDKASLS